MARTSESGTELLNWFVFSRGITAQSRASNGLHVSESQQTYPGIQINMIFRGIPLQLAGQCCLHVSENLDLAPKLLEINNIRGRIQLYESLC